MVVRLLSFLVIAGISCAALSDLAAPPTNINPFPACDTLVRFGAIKEGLYHGSKPRTENDFKCLKAMNIKTILNLEDRFLRGQQEAIWAKKYQIQLLYVAMQPSPVPPLDMTVNSAMSIITDTRLYPLYFHCHLGRDRTMLMLGLYENRVMGKSAQEAWNDMLHFGFSTSPTLWGLQHYFWDNVK